MTRSRAPVLGLLFAGAAVLALAAARPATARRGELVVRNQSFSSLEISVLIGTEETRIGTAPPEFSNTLYFPVPAEPGTVRFRARLPGARDVLHQSRPRDAREGMRLRWTLPENRLDPVREHHGGSSRMGDRLH